MDILIKFLLVLLFICCCIFTARVIGSIIAAFAVEDPDTMELPREPEDIP